MAWDMWEELRGSLCLPVPAPMTHQDCFPCRVFPELRICQLVSNPNPDFLWEGREQLGGLEGCTFPGGYRPF